MRWHFVIRRRGLCRPPKLNRKLLVERLEERALLAISLQGVPTWHEEGPGPIVGSSLVAGISTPNNPSVGAIESLAIDPNNADLIYVGSVTGGVWKTTNATDAQPTWSPLTDQLPSLSIGAVAISPFDPNVVYAGVGCFSRVRSPESNGPGVGDRAPLTGILRSTDGGATWSQHGQVEFADQSVRSIVPGALLPGGQVVLAATVVGGSSNTFGSAASGGLYRSVDAGVSWTLVSGGGGLPLGDVSDVIADPANPDRYYAAIAGDFDANNDGMDNDAIPWNNKGVFVSFDHGQTWVRANSGMQADFRRGATRIELSAQDYPALDAQSMYAAIVDGDGLKTIYRTTDGGGNWAGWLFDISDDDRMGSGLHFISLLADQDDPRAVWVSGNNDSPPGGGSVGVVLRGADGPNGYSYQRMILEATADTAPHEDSRDMIYDADGHILEVDDGGIYRLRNPSLSSRRWESVNGDLRISEFYSLAYDHVADTIIGGTQDNGTAERRDPADFTWDFVHGADGNFVAVDLRNPDARLHYSSSQNLGGFEYQVYDDAHALLARVPIGLAVNDTPGVALNKRDPDNRRKFVFDASINQVTPYVLNAVNPDRMLIGTQYLYESSDRGQTVTSLGGVRNRNNDGKDNDNDGQADDLDPEQDEFVAADWSNDGVDNDGDGIVDGVDNDGDGDIDVPDPEEPALGRITALVYGGFVGADPLESMALIGTDSGLWTSSGLNAQGVLNYPNQVAAYPGDGVRAIVTDPLDARYIYVADVNGSIWHHRGFGNVWYNLTGNLGDLADDLRTLELKVFRDGNGVVQNRVLFAGGEGGVYRRRSAEFNQQGVWTRFGDGLPNVTVTDLHYDPTDDMLLAGTFGRGVWSIPQVNNYAAQPSILNLLGDPSQLDDELRLVLNDYNPLLVDVFFNNPGNEPTLSLPLSALEAIVFLGKEGNDHLIANFSRGEILPASGLIFGGDIGEDRVTVIGTEDDDEYKFRGQNIDTPSRRTFNHSAESVRIEGRGGDDTLSAESILNQWALTLDGGAGCDTFRVTPNGRDVGQLGGSLTIVGGGIGNDSDCFLHQPVHVDVAEIHDQQDGYEGEDPLNIAYHFAADRVTRSLARDILFSDLDAITVWAGAANDEFFVDATPPLSVELLPVCPIPGGIGPIVRSFLCLNAGEGNDVLRLAATTQDASTLTRDVWFNAVEGDDELFLHDGLNPFAREYSIDSDSINVENLDARYGDVEAVLIEAGTNIDAFHVNEPPLTHLTLVGGEPHDAPGDSLTLTGTGDSDGVYGPSAGTPGDGAIDVDGHVIEFQGLEPIHASGFRTFRLTTPNPDDDLVVDAPQALWHRVSGTSGGVAFESLAVQDVDRLILDTADHNGLFGVDRVRFIGGDLPLSGVGVVEVVAAPGSATLDVEGGNTSIVAADGLRDVRVSGPSAVLRVLSSIRADLLSIGAGSKVVLEAGGDSSLHVVRLEIEGDSLPLGTLDIQDNGLIVNYAPGEPSSRPLHINQINHARDEYFPTLWAGHGITSAAAAGEPNRLEIVVDEAAAYFAAAGGAFHGVALAAGDDALLIRTVPVAPGDLTGDGGVGLHDLAVLQSHLGPAGPAGWEHGDFTGDGVVDRRDLLVFVRNYGAAGPPAPAAAAAATAVVSIPTAAPASLNRPRRRIAATSVRAIDAAFSDRRHGTETTSPKRYLAVGARRALLESQRDSTTQPRSGRLRAHPESISALTLAPSSRGRLLSRRLSFARAHVPCVSNDT